MKKIILTLGFFSFFSNSQYAQSKNGFEVNGKITNAEGKKIYLSTPDLSPLIDSFIIQNGSFIFKGKVKEPGYYTIFLQKNPQNYMNIKRFILSNEKLFLNGSGDSMYRVRITGSKEIEAAKKLNAIISPYYNSQSDSFDSALASLNRGDTITSKKFGTINLSITKRINDSIAAFIKRHPNSYISLSYLNDLHTYYGAKKAKELYFSLSPRLQKVSLGQRLKYEIFEVEQLTALNKKAIQFEQKDTSDNIIKLSDFNGKYVLLDFWASWCIPCREENGNLKLAFSKYQSKGFEILGISLDSKKDAWIKAINQDQLTWKNASDFRGWNNSVAKMYGIREVPANFLLDRTGKIVAKNLRGAELLNKLKAIFGE